MTHYKNINEFVWDLVEINNKSNPHYKFMYFKKEYGIQIKTVFMGFPNDKSQDKYIGNINSTYYPFPKHLI
jgi:hypothetical protein